MAVGMASFTMNDAITKEVSSEMNFGQVMLVRGIFAMLLMAALFLRQSRVRKLNSAMVRRCSWARPSAGGAGWRSRPALSACS
jgi:hypothetical protein